MNSITTKTLRIAVCSSALLLSSCMFGPDFEDPQMDMPAVFRDSSKSAESIADLPWWKVFKDKNLERLIEEALSNNKNLVAAIARVEQAREVITMTNSSLFPNVGYNASTAHAKNSSGAGPSMTYGEIVNPISLGGTASWYMDFWGKVRRQSEGSVAQYMASEEAQRALMLSLVQQVATYYLQLIEYDLELKITQKTVESFQASLKLFEEQMAGGIGDVLQVSSAEAALAAAAAKIPGLESQRSQTENALCILLGRAPSAIKRSSSIDWDDFSVNVPSGIPAQLLSRRPDIRQSEQQLRAANAQIGVAIANYFPDISLTSNLGLISSDLTKISKDNSFSWGIGANLTGPIFQAGALSANERKAKAAFLEAKANYEQTVLQALGDVSSALVQRQKLTSVIAQSERSVKAYETAVEASFDRFKNGLSGYYEVLTAQQNLFPVEITLSQARLSYTLTLVQLYSALGGGWKFNNNQFMKKN